MANALTEDSLETLFTKARTFNGWKSQPLPEGHIRRLYELFKWGPTSSNCCPARFVWVVSEEGKAKLAELASGGNRTKILAAPCTVIIGYDLQFLEMMPKLFPARAEIMQQALKPVAESTAFRNGSLQGAYLILAARALGLDCGPMSGFNNAAVDRHFFAGTEIKSNFICSIGFGDPASVYPRNPRLSFEEAGRFA